MPELPRQQEVVGVEKDDVVAAGGAKPGIARAALAEVHVAGMVEVADPRRVTRGGRPRDVGAGVGRPVVDENQLEAIVLLCLDARDRLLEVRAGVAEGDDHRHGSRGGVRAPADLRRDGPQSCRERGPIRVLRPPKLGCERRGDGLIDRQIGNVPRQPLEERAPLAVVARVGEALARLVRRVAAVAGPEPARDVRRRAQVQLREEDLVLIQAGERRLEPACLLVCRAAHEGVARRRGLDAVLEELWQQPERRVEAIGRDAEVVEVSRCAPCSGPSCATSACGRRPSRRPGVRRGRRPARRSCREATRRRRRGRRSARRARSARPASAPRSCRGCRSRRAERAGRVPAWHGRRGRRSPRSGRSSRRRPRRAPGWRYV